MEISIGSLYSINPNLPAGKEKPPANPRRSKERRKKNQDRRKSVRDGVLVSLSLKEDRRKRRDRRSSGR